MKTAYSYTRISTPEQRKGQGLTRQTEAAVAYCKANQLRLDDTLKLSDEGLSAFHGDNLLRGKLGMFLKLVEHGKVKRGSLLLVESGDRLSRANVLDAQELFLSIINKGITLVTLMDNQVYSREEITKNPWKLMVSLSVMIRANEESETKSKRVSNARQKRKQEAKNGALFRIYTPPWCNWVDGRYELDTPKVKLLKRIFQMYLDGKGPTAIASTLNAEGVTAFGRGTAVKFSDHTDEWYKKIVACLLVDKRLLGYAHWIDKNDYFPRAIPENLFNQVQHRLNARKRTGGQIGKGPVNIFAGFMKCGHCGGTMAKTRCTNREGYQYFYYVCEMARTGKGSCEYRSVLMDTVEDSFLFLMRMRPWFEENLTENGVAEQLEQRIESLKGELVGTEKQVEKINKLILADDNPPKSIVTTLKELERKEENLKAHIANEEGKRAELGAAQPDETFFHNLPEKMKDPDYRLKVRELLRNQINKITFYPRADFPHYHIQRNNGKIWSVVFSDASRKHRNFQIHRGKVTVFTFEPGKGTWQYEGDGKNSID